MLVGGDRLTDHVTKPAAASESPHDVLVYFQLAHFCPVLFAAVTMRGVPGRVPGKLLSRLVFKTLNIQIKVRKRGRYYLLAE